MTCSTLEAPCPVTTRKERVAVRSPLCIPLCYRLIGQQQWLEGETVDVSHSGILFYSEQILEIDETIEIIFQASEISSAGAKRARVVRRVLNNWPETRALLGVQLCN